MGQTKHIEKEKNMKKITAITFTLFLFIVGNAYCFDFENTKKICHSLSSFAYTVEWGHQKGADLTDTLGILYSDRFKNSNKYAKNIMKSIVLDAFDLPIMDSYSEKEYIAQKFSNKVKIECIYELLDK